MKTLLPVLNSQFGGNIYAYIVKVYRIGASLLVLVVV